MLLLVRIFLGILIILIFVKLSQVVRSTLLSVRHIRILMHFVSLRQAVATLTGTRHVESLRGDIY